MCMASEHNYPPSGLSPLWSGVFRSPMHIPQAAAFYFRENQHLFWLNFPIHFSSRIQMGFLFSTSLSSFTTLGEKSFPNLTSVFLCRFAPFPVKEMGWQCGRQQHNQAPANLQSLASQSSRLGKLLGNPEM